MREDKAPVGNTGKHRQHSENIAQSTTIFPTIFSKDSMRLLYAALLVTTQLASVAQAADVGSVTDNAQNASPSTAVTPQADKPGQQASVPAVKQIKPKFNAVFQSNINKFSVAYDSLQWTLIPKGGNDTDPNMHGFSYVLNFFNGIVYTDAKNVPLDVFKKFIIFNTKEVTNADVKVVLDETENVNGKQIGTIRLAANIQKTDFLLESRYYTGPEGSFQLTCGGPTKLFLQYETDCKSFLQGLTIAE